MTTDHPYVDTKEGSVTCPICGCIGGVGLPRHATVETVVATSNPGSDETDEHDHRRKKCRPQRCSGGHSFEICFTC